jgi:hypothetical protein
VLEKIEAGDLLKVCAQGLTYFEREEKDLGLLLFPQVRQRQLARLGLFNH